MTAALSYEWVRIRTIRSTWWLTGIAVVIGLLIAFGVSWGTAYDLSQGHRPSGDDARLLGSAVVTQFSAVGVPCLVGFVLAMIGILGWGHEYRHGMIRASLTALNSRSSLWVAKYVVVAAWAAVVTFVVCLLSGAIGWLFLHEYDVAVFTGRSWQMMGREVAYVVLLAWLAMAFTAITRSQAFALVLVFLWPLLVESIIIAIMNLTPGLKEHSDLTRFLPFQAGYRILDISTPAHGLFGQPLAAGGGFVVFGGVAVVLMLGSWSLLHARDA